MTNDDRLTRNRKLKDEGNTKSKKKNASPPSISGSADASGLRRSGRETSSKQATTSPSSARKSERIEKQASPSSPLIKKKSENIVKQMAGSPLRRSDRGKKQFSPGSSGSKKLAEIPASSNIKSKKEKIPSSSKESVGDANEDNKDERQDPDVGGRKRKRMTARGYKALFKPQRIRVEADDSKDPNGQEKSPQANSSSNGYTAMTITKHDNVETGPCLKEPRINHGLENQQELDPCYNTGEGGLCGTSSSKTVKLNKSTMPHKLLKKRLLLSFKPLNESQEDAGKVLDYHYEWLVEWQGLDNGKATWELESAVLGSPEGQHLIKEYDHGHGKMGISAPLVDKTKEPSVKPPISPAGGPPGMDQIHFSYVKKLQDSWTKEQNRHLQERAMRVVLFILSLNGVTHPFLIITTSGSLAQWEAMFLNVAPSNDLKVSIEVRDTQRSVRLLEAQKEGGELVFQVLLYCVDAFVEDLSMLKNINWEAIMVDESQCLEISAHFDDIKSLSTNKRLLLFGGPIGENMAEYLNVLSLVGYDDALSNNTRSKAESDDSLGKLKETLSQYVAYECKSDPSKFVEFWVPVQLSNLQLEQYCVALFSNAMVLRSCSKSDTIGAFHDILISNRKCCNHPYIVDPNLQGLIMKDREPTMLLDVGIKASGKLQFLDLILPEVKKRQLRVVILFQPTVGTAKGLASVGDILDDFLHHRFGQDSYERIDGVGIVPSKKQAALNNFNKDMSRFVFLLEHRGCQASIKLSSVDIIVIFDSDLNPAYDLKALQKISIDSQSEQIMIFRLYSSCTLEEKILRLAEQSVAIDGKLQNLNRSSCDALLMFGVSDLLNKVTQFHSSSVLNISSEESFLKDVLEEFLYLISHKCNSKDTSKSIITRVKSCGIYGKNIPLHTPLPFGEQPHLFWRKLLEGKCPRWKFVSLSTPRQRKRPHYFEDSSKETSAAHADVGKKRKKTLNSSIEPAASKLVVEAETGRTNEGASGVPAHNESQSSSGDHFWSTAVHSERSLHHLLKPTVSELCEVLKLSEDVKMTVERFLDFVLENYHVSKEHTSTLQAFMISLCWIASSLSGYKIDRRESFALAKKHLNFSCMEEEANSVYLKLEPAKEMFLLHTDNQEKCDAFKDCIQAPQATCTESTEPKMSHSLLPNPQEVKPEIVDGQHADVSGSHELSNEEMLQSAEKMQNECKDDLATKDQKEMERFNREWDEKRMLLENDYKVEKALIRTLHSNPSVRSEKLKSLDKVFANNLEEHDRMREIHLKDLMAKLSAGEGQIIANCIPSFSEGRANNELTLHESQHENQMVHSGNSIQEAQDVPEADPISSTNLIEVQNHDRMIEPSVSLGDLDGGNVKVNAISLEFVGARIEDQPKSGKNLHTGANLVEPNGLLLEEEPGTMVEPSNRVGNAHDGVNNIGSTGSHTSEKQRADATVSSVPTEENPAQQHDGIDNNVVGHVDSVESGVPEVDSNEENAKGGNTSPAVKDCNETGPGDMLPHVDSAVKDRNETGPVDMQPHVDFAEMGTLAGNCNKDTGQDSTIIPDTLHVEDQNDSCGSSSSNSPSAAVSPDKTPTVELVASPASDHSMPTIPEIQNESLQLQQLPCSGSQDKEGQPDPSSVAEIDVDNLQPVDAGQVGQINSEDPPLEPLDELSFPLSTDLPIAENQSDILPASGILLEATREEPTLPGGPSQSAENHTNPSDDTMLQSSGNLEEHQPSSDAVHDQPSVEPRNSAQNSKPPVSPLAAEIPNQNASRPEMSMFDVQGS
ncbi:Chromo domain/shadow, partial [Cynara cardunculus var. scolymus]